MQGHPLGRAVPITAAHDATAFKWLPTPELDGVRSTPTVLQMVTVLNKLVEL